VFWTASKGYSCTGLRALCSNGLLPIPRCVIKHVVDEALLLKPSVSGVHDNTFTVQTLSKGIRVQGLEMPIIELLAERPYFFYQNQDAGRQTGGLIICPAFTYPMDSCTECDVSSECIISCKCGATSSTSSDLNTCSDLVLDENMNFICADGRSRAMIGFGKRYFCDEIMLHHAQWIEAFQSHASNCAIVMKTPDACAEFNYFVHDMPETRGIIRIDKMRCG